MVARKRNEGGHLGRPRAAISQNASHRVYSNHHRPTCRPRRNGVIASFSLTRLGPLGQKHRRDGRQPLEMRSSMPLRPTDPLGSHSTFIRMTVMPRRGQNNRIFLEVSLDGFQRQVAWSLSENRQAGGTSAPQYRVSDRLSGGISMPLCKGRSRSVSPVPPHAPRPAR